MNKLKEIFIVLCILLIALVLASCTGDTPKPSGEGGETVQPGGDPETDDPSVPGDGVFTITQDRFTAEKAALAMYDAVTAKMQQGTSRIIAKDESMTVEFATDEGMIGAGSYLKMTPAGENNFEIDSFVIYKEGNVPAVYAVMKGTATDISFTDFKVSLFALTDENKNPIEGASWNEMPAVFLVKTKGQAIKTMIDNFVRSWNPASSVNGRSLTPVQDGTQSFYNPQDGKGWIVYTDSADGSSHKVNFNSNNISAFTLDGWCEVGDGYNASVSETPAVKSEDPGMLSDEEALELGTEAYAYCYSVNMTTDWNNRPEWINQPEESDSGMKITIDNHTEPDFFGESAVVKAEINTGSSGAVFTLTVNGKEIKFEAVGNSNASAIAGEIRTFTIDGNNYSHLRDELYLACIRVFTSTSNIVSLFNEINDTNGIKHWWKNVTVSEDGTTYTFKDSTQADWLLEHSESESQYRLNGEILIDEDSFTLNLVFEEISKSDNSVLTTTEVSAGGTLTENARPQFSSLRYLNHGFDCNENELRIINLISASMQMIVA